MSLEGNGQVSTLDRFYRQMWMMVQNLFLILERLYDNSYSEILSFANLFFIYILITDFLNQSTDGTKNSELDRTSTRASKSSKRPDLCHIFNGKK